MAHPWLLVAGDFTPLGGMDRANHALALQLASRGREVHVVTHRAWPDLASRPSVSVHLVRRPLGWHLLGSPLLASTGRRLWQQLHADGVRAVVNGGNCPVAAANWVHYLHAAHEPEVSGSWVRRAKSALADRRDRTAEREALGRATVIICNSRRTQADVVDRIGVPPDRTRVVYYGTDPLAFGPPTADERAAARQALGVPGDRPLVGFVGALGDRRKAFDSVFAAWVDRCADRTWDADLVVVGAGAELPAWRDQAAAAGLETRIRFLGFREDVPRILAAVDALVHPARYEAYGLSVHEAICRGVPAIVSRSAGVAELYPNTLSDLLVDDPDDVHEIAERLRTWRSGLERWREDLAPLSSRLRARHWSTMAAEIVDVVDGAAA
jgi:glycosyltransferase involved in cell wall biosynthesis